MARANGCKLRLYNAEEEAEGLSRFCAELEAPIFSLTDSNSEIESLFRRGQFDEMKKKQMSNSVDYDLALESQLEAQRIISLAESNLEAFSELKKQALVRQKRSVLVERLKLKPIAEESAENVEGEQKRGEAKEGRDSRRRVQSYLTREDQVSASSHEDVLIRLDREKS